MSVIFNFWIALTFGLVVAAIVSLPSWLFASMNRGTLWCLRDEIFDARREGLLPDVEVVDEMLRHAEDLILAVPNMSAAQVWWITRKTEPEPLGGRLPLVNLELPPDSTQQQQLFFAAVRVGLMRSLLRQYIVCSWSGLLLVAPRNLASVRFVLSRKYGHRRLMESASQTHRPPAEMPEPPKTFTRDREAVIQGIVTRRVEWHGARGDDLVAAGG